MQNLIEIVESKNPKNLLPSYYHDDVETCLFFSELFSEVYSEFSEYNPFFHEGGLGQGEYTSYSNITFRHTQTPEVLPNGIRRINLAQVSLSHVAPIGIIFFYIKELPKSWIKRNRGLTYYEDEPQQYSNDMQKWYDKYSKEHYRKCELNSANGLDWNGFKVDVEEFLENHGVSIQNKSQLESVNIKRFNNLYDLEMEEPKTLYDALFYTGQDLSY